MTMTMTIGKAAKTAGVTIRTLRHYEAKGLLMRSGKSGSGYSLYDEEDLARLQQILFYRELDFSIEQIKRMMINPNFNRHSALKNHAELLRMKRDRLNDLIGLAEDMMKGDKMMSFKEFDKTEIDNARKEYSKEAEERWGGTAEYAESHRRTKKYTKADWQRISVDSGRIFNGFKCTDEILAGLGAAYSTDERFMKNIDRFGEGLSKYMGSAIAHYCATSGK